MYRAVCLEWAETSNAQLLRPEPACVEKPFDRGQENCGITRAINLTQVGQDLELAPRQGTCCHWFCRIEAIIEGNDFISPLRIAATQPFGRGVGIDDDDIGILHDR